MPCDVQLCQATQGQTRQTSFISTCHLRGWGPTSISSLLPCQQASSSILDLLRPIFPLTSCSGCCCCCYAFCNSPPLMLWITFPSATPPVKVVLAWFHWALTAANFIYHNTPHVMQAPNLGLLCFSAYYCRAFLPCTILFPLCSPIQDLLCFLRLLSLKFGMFLLT